MADTAHFWDKLAARYAAKPVKDPDAYRVTLDRTRTYLSSADRVLEVGCGTGSTALLLAPGVAQITATDYSAGMIRIAQGKLADGPANVCFRQEGLAASDPDEVTFDAVLGFNLLHLIEDIPAALATLRDRLKPGGYLITKSGCLGGRAIFLKLLIGLMRAVGKAPAVTFVSADQLDRMIEAAGFRIVERADIPKGSHNHFVVAQRL